MTTAFDALHNWDNSNIRKALKGSVFIAPESAALVTASILFDAATGDLKSPLPAGFKDLGYLDATGAKLGRAVKTTDTTSWQDTSPTRSDVTSDVTTLVINPQETNQETIALYEGIPIGSITPGANGVIEVQRASVSSQIYYRVLVIGVDELTEGEYAMVTFFPRMLVTAYADQIYAAADDIVYGVTLQAYVDSQAGFAVDKFWGGAAQLARLPREDFSRVVTCTTSSTVTPTVLVATVGTFTPDDVDAPLHGTGMATGATVLSYTDPTHVVMSAAATASGTGVAITVG